MRISDWSSDVCSSDLLSMTQVLSQTIGTSLPTLSTCYPCHRIILLPISPDRTLRNPLPRGERENKVGRGKSAGRFPQPRSAVVRALTLYQTPEGKAAGQPGGTSMTERPPFRADHVTRFLRPPRLA